MAHRAMNCRATSICITDYIILFDNPIAAIFRNDPSCFAGSRMSLASCEPHSSETSNQLKEKIAARLQPAKCKIVDILLTDVFAQVVP
jgi:hypothetical protein